MALMIRADGNPLIHSVQVKSPVSTSAHLLLSSATWLMVDPQDAQLRRAVDLYDAKNWKRIAACLKGRSDVQCLHRWQKVLRPGLIKGPWTKEVRRAAERG